MTNSERGQYLPEDRSCQVDQWDPESERDERKEIKQLKIAPKREAS